MSDAAAFEEQLAYLLERSPFYRDKLKERPRVALEDRRGYNCRNYTAEPMN